MVPREEGWQTLLQDMIFHSSSLGKTEKAKLETELLKDFGNDGNLAAAAVAAAGDGGG